MNRKENLRRLANESFDLCIIGGGASGAGCALDAALRGLKVALVEGDDFAAGASSRSTKLIHGGVRYLEQAIKNLDFAQLRQVRHGLEERGILLANAPHLARPVALLTPVFRWWESWYYAIGLKLYDSFAAGRRTAFALTGSSRLSRAEALSCLPALHPRLRGAVRYYDGQMDDARYCLALVQSAAEAGAVVVNHLEVLDFQKNENGQIVGATLRNQLADNQQFTFSARYFLNCTGPFSDRIRHLANVGLPPRIRPSKGVHVVLPASVLPGGVGLLIPKTPDGRMVFALPFQGSLLLGTTDQDYRDLDREPVLEAAEVDFLLKILQPYLAEKIDRRQVKAGFGGLRPLIAGSNKQINKSSNQQTKRLLRDHEVEYDPASGLFSLLGGKWTTYRLMARDAVDAVCRLLGNTAECRTADFRLAGAEGYAFDDWQKIQAEYVFDPDVCQHLMLHYGARAAQVAALTREQAAWRERLHPGFPYLAAEVVYAARAEMAGGVRDVLARRLRMEVADWSATMTAAPVVAELLGAEFGWSGERRHAAATDYIALLRGFWEQAGEL